MKEKGTEKLSKSEVKRRFKQIEAAAQEIAGFSEKDLKKLPGSDSFHDEIRQCRGLKAGSRKRQIKYLAKIMRDESLEEIFTYLEREKGSKIKTDGQFHEAERLRDTIINEALEYKQQCQSQGLTWDPDWQSDGIEEMMSAYPELDEDTIRKCVHQYGRTRNKLHYRELFRIIKAAVIN